MPFDPISALKFAAKIRAALQILKISTRLFKQNIALAEPESFSEPYFRYGYRSSSFLKISPGPYSVRKLNFHSFLFCQNTLSPVIPGM
ncbi:MAG: hypothetical protein BGO53_10995 [Sphingobacteriales bacterium 39-19]|nr:MAG: hypothetical protein BGO53_10995 [Sphingobacteriales bacterium 39-19]